MPWYENLPRGRKGTERKRSLVLLEPRLCLLGRVARVGEGHRLAVRRRAWVRKENEKREKARIIHWAANVLEKGVFKRGGQFVMDN